MDTRGEFGGDREKTVVCHCEERPAGATWQSLSSRTKEIATPSFAPLRRARNDRIILDKNSKRCKLMLDNKEGLVFNNSKGGNYE